MLGCFRRHCISFANGESDTRTRVFWIQSRNFTVDLRLPETDALLSAAPFSDQKPSQQNARANSEGWFAHTHWDGQQLSWSGGSDFQLHTRWPEPALLQRVGNCLIETAPSGIYMEDWRLQPSDAGPLVGLELIEERNLETDQVLHRGGGVIICGEYAALVRGRAESIDDARPNALRQRLLSGIRDSDALLAFETSLAHGNLTDGFTITHTLQPERQGQPLMPLDGFEPHASGELWQRLEIEGRNSLRRYRVDSAEARFVFSLATPADDNARAWFQQESDTLTRYTRTLR
ncbi:hypothetical protein GCM10007426_23060 [Alloalcanivorax dieselolei]|nr:hypothetical protein GCM10007426_23060 [Alloalcanivorax dieselolei]